MILPQPRPADEPDELIQHVYEDDGKGQCSVVEASVARPGHVCGRRREVHHLLVSATYEELADTNSEAFRLFKAAAGRDAIVKAFSPGGGGIAELQENIARTKAEIAQERASSAGDDAVMSVCPACGAEQEDMDGFGVLKCEHCGYCSHASVDGDTCGLCGAKVSFDGD